MINKVQKSEVAPIPKQWEDFSPESGSKSSALGLGVDIRTSSKKVFIETYGCPYGASLHDDFDHFKADKWLGVKGL